MPGSTRLWKLDDTSPVKRYLMEYVALKQRRDALTDEIDRLRDATLRATSRITGFRPSGSPDPGRKEDGVLRVVDAQARLATVISHIDEALCARLALLEQLPDERQKTLLTLRYINGVSWEQIGYAMHYERTQIFDIHHQALEAAQLVLEIWRDTQPDMACAVAK